MGRIESVQPFVTKSASDEGLHFLKAVTELDNIHKHRIPLIAAPAPASVPLTGDMRLEEGAVGEAHTEFALTIDELQPEDPILRFSFGRTLTPDSTVDSPIAIELTATLWVNDRYMPVDYLHHFILANAYKTIRFLLEGESAEGQTFEGHELA